MASKYACGLGACVKSFPTKKELKNHFAAAPHRKLKVACILCPVFQSFARVSEWKRHCEAKHKVQLLDLDPDFTSESNAAWFALNPVVYRRVVPAPAWSTPLSGSTREMVLLWASTQGSAPRTEEEWEEGWENLKANTIKAVPESTDVSDDVLYIITEGDISIGPEEETPIMEYDPLSSQCDASTQLELKTITLQSSNATAMFFTPGGGFVYEAFISEEAIMDAKAFDNLTRRMKALGRAEPVPRPSGQGKRLEGGQLETRRATLASLLGIKKSLITNITHWTSPFASRTTSPKSRETRTPERQQKRSRHVSKSPRKVPAKFPRRVEGTDHPRPSSPRRPREEDTAREARKILSVGCMPLLPPARRDWTNHLIHISAGTSNITWPPRSWETLSPDQRLLQWEFAAMTLEEGLQGRIPRIDRSFLHDKWNMLALPGTALNTEDRSPSRKSRLYNYRTLLEISQGRICGQTARATILMYQAAQRHRTTDTDRVVRCIEAERIGLRLEADL